MQAAQDHVNATGLVFIDWADPILYLVVRTNSNTLDNIGAN
jgi:hypothetical protein